MADQRRLNVTDKAIRRAQALGEAMEGVEDTRERSRLRWEKSAEEQERRRGNLDGISAFRRLIEEGSLTASQIDEFLGRDRKPNVTRGSEREKSRLSGKFQIR